MSRLKMGSRRKGRLLCPGSMAVQVVGGHYGSGRRLDALAHPIGAAGPAGVDQIGAGLVLADFFAQALGVGGRGSRQQEGAPKQVEKVATGSSMPRRCRTRLGGSRRLAGTWPFQLSRLTWWARRQRRPRRRSDDGAGCPPTPGSGAGDVLHLGCAHPGVLGEVGVLKVAPTRVDRVHHRFSTRAPADGVVDAPLGFVLLGQVDALAYSSPRC